MGHDGDGGVWGVGVSQMWLRSRCLVARLVEKVWLLLGASLEPRSRMY